MLANSHKKDFENISRTLDLFSTKIDTIIAKLDKISENTGNGTAVTPAPPEPVVYTATFVNGTADVTGCDTYINDIKYDTVEDIVIGTEPDSEITVKFVPHEGYGFDNEPYISDITVPGSTKVINTGLDNGVYTAVYTFKDTCLLSLSAMAVLQPVTIPVTFSVNTMENARFTAEYNNITYDNPDVINIMPGDILVVNFYPDENYLINQHQIRFRGSFIEPYTVNDTSVSYQIPVDSSYTGVNLDLIAVASIIQHTVIFDKDITCGFNVQYGDAVTNNPDSLIVNHGEDINIRLLTSHNGVHATSPTITYDGNVFPFDDNDTKTINITKNMDIKIYTDYTFGPYDENYENDDFDPLHADTPDLLSYNHAGIYLPKDQDTVIDFKHVKYFVLATIKSSEPIHVTLEYTTTSGEKSNTILCSPQSGKIYLCDVINNCAMAHDNSPCTLIIHNHGDNDVQAEINIWYTTKLNLDVLTIKGGQTSTVTGARYLTLPNSNLPVYAKYTASINTYNDSLSANSIYDARYKSIELSCTVSCQYYYVYKLYT